MERSAQSTTTTTLTIQIAWQEPQKIAVRHIGPVFIFEFADCLGRRRVVEGTVLPYGVTLFASRIPSDVTRFVVYGEWTNATYRQFDGALLPVKIHGR